ncbi:MAG: hypothetical protein KBA86_05395 [Bacteroidales bacterium]|nr:hypothetical protein [Bacteroidales bacterium]
MKTKKLIYVGCLLITLLLTGCKKYDLTDPEQFMYGKWKITRMDTCSKGGEDVTVLENKGIFYFHEDLTCDIKYTGLKPFAFGKTFYWTRTCDSYSCLEIYNDSTYFLCSTEKSGNDIIELFIRQKDVIYDVLLTRM